MFTASLDDRSPAYVTHRGISSVRFDDVFHFPDGSPLSGSPNAANNEDVDTDENDGAGDGTTDNQSLLQLIRAGCRTRYRLQDNQRMRVIPG